MTDAVSGGRGSSAGPSSRVGSASAGGSGGAAAGGGALSALQQQQMLEMQLRAGSLMEKKKQIREVFKVFDRENKGACEERCVFACQCVCV